VDIRKAALVAEVVGGLGVIVSLVFVGLQVRTNATAQEAQAILDLRLAMTQLQRELTATPEISDFLYRGINDYGSLTGPELFRFRQLVGNTLNTYAIAFEYGQLGRIDAEELAAWEQGICSVLSGPGAREVYRDWTMIGDEFRAWVESSCPGLNLTP
jgi:hypothetical protein